MWTRELRKLTVVAAVTAAVGLTSGCGFEVDITDDPDPAIVGQPVKYTIDVKFVDTGTAEAAALLVVLMPTTSGLCDFVDDFDLATLSATADPLAKIEEKVPGEILSALPGGMSLEDLAARLGGAVQAATSQAGVTCEPLDEVADGGDIDGLDSLAFLCMLGDIPSMQTETAMIEFVPHRAGVFSAIAVAVACEPKDPAQEGGGAGFPGDELFMCGGQIPAFVGIDCEETVVQSRLGAPLASALALAVLSAVLAFVGVTSRRRR